jgi:hypothetical protein
MEIEHNHEHGHHQGQSRRKLHHDWRLWLVVGLMLGAMLIYVFSDNERFGQGGGAARMPPPTPSTNK